MKLYRLNRKQILPISLEESWAFFSTPHNLERITPDWLNFSIRSPVEEMYAGMVIEYKITLPPGIPTRWVTEITHVDAPYFFVDEQRLGPYQFWHHQHRFRSVSGGVELEDIVHYSLPLGWIGRLAHFFWVNPQLQAIFHFRHQYLQQHFTPGKESMVSDES